MNRTLPIPDLPPPLPPSQVEGFSLFVKDLIMWVPARKKLFSRKTIPQADILKGVTCEFPAGQMIAIVGPSGSGKTTLMNFLAGRHVESRAFKYYAEYFINNTRVENVNAFKNLIGYVLQEDLMEAGLTPRQTFEFYAKMRRHPNPAQLTTQIIAELELTKCADTIIGNAKKRGLSGGEKKRVNIGIELVSDPNVLFLDEPTTGLDSVTAVELAYTLRRLRDRGMTVITVIHSPAAEVLELFDKVVMLCAGRLIYDAPPSAMTERLAHFGFGVPLYVSPIEQLMRLIDKKETQIALAAAGSNDDEEEVERTHAALIDSFFQYQSLENVNRPLASTASVPLEALKELSKVKNQPPNIFIQAWMLTQLLFYLMFKDLPLFLLRSVIFFALGGFFAVVYMNLGDRNTFEGVQSRVGVLYLLGTFYFSVGVNALSTLFVERKRIYLKDHEKRMYSSTVFYIVNQLYQLPYYILVCTLLFVIVYAASGLNHSSASAFFWFCLFLVGVFLGGGSMAIIISVMVDTFQDVSAMGPLIILPVNILAGYFAKTKDIMEPLRTISYLSPMRYAFQGAVLTEFGDGFNNAFYSFYEDTKLANALALAALIVGYRFFFYFFFIYRLRERNPSPTNNSAMFEKYAPHLLGDVPLPAMSVSAQPVASPFV